MRSGVRDAVETTNSVSATGTGSIAAYTVAVRSASTVVRISIGL